MAPPIAKSSQKESTSLWDMAQNLREASNRKSRLAPLVFMTDPERTPDPVRLMERLPRGMAIIYRYFGADDRADVAQALRQVTSARDQQLLIGADPELALAIGADGVHFRRDKALTEARKWRAAQPNWIITMAALKGLQDYDMSLDCLDGLFISSVFDSDSPSAGTPIGVEALKGIADKLDVPIFALGGITRNTAADLIGTGIAGIAAIGGMIEESRMSELEITMEATPQGHRFVYRLEGHKEAEITLIEVGPDLFNASHTGVPKSMGGKGVGKALIKAMSDHARENGYKVIPGCPFVGAMWKRNPDWAEGVAAN